MLLSEMEWQAVILTLQLAATSTILLLLLGTPLALWLSRQRGTTGAFIEALVALPLVLPPTVLGFYLLLMLAPDALPGKVWAGVTGTQLAFSFPALVIGSVLYSMPFVVQPLQNAFVNVGTKPMEAAWCLRASRLDTFMTVILPLSIRGYITAAVLGFTHTIGEFGVVLMVGGSIPGETQVLSIAIYEHVEVLDYSSAHVLSAGLLAFTFVVLLAVYIINRRYPVHAN